MPAPPTRVPAPFGEKKERVAACSFPLKRGVLGCGGKCVDRMTKNFFFATRPDTGSITFGIVAMSPQMLQTLTSLPPPFSTLRTLMVSPKPPHHWEYHRTH